MLCLKVIRDEESQKIQDIHKIYHIKPVIKTAIPGT